MILPLQPLPTRWRSTRFAYGSTSGHSPFSPTVQTPGRHRVPLHQGRAFTKVPAILLTIQGQRSPKVGAEYSTITVGRHIEFEASLVRCGWQRVVVVRASELFRSLRHQDEGFAGGGCGVVGVAAAVAVVGSSATTISPSQRGRPLRNPCDTKGPFTLKAPLFKIPRCGMRAELSVVHSG